MINELELKACFVRQGMTQNDVANALSMSSHTLSNKIKRNTLTTKEVSELISLLKITDPLPIFFATNLTSQVKNLN